MTTRTYTLPTPWAGFVINGWNRLLPQWLVADWPKHKNKSNLAQLAALVRDYSAFFTRETKRTLGAASFGAAEEKHLRDLLERLIALKNLWEEERRKTDSEA